MCLKLENDVIYTRLSSYTTSIRGMGLLLLRLPFSSISGIFRILSTPLPGFQDMFSSKIAEISGHVMPQFGPKLPGKNPGSNVGVRGPWYNRSESARVA